jgi:hypothetical protein
VTSFGRLWARNIASNGCGWQSIVKHAKMSEWPLVRAQRRRRASSSLHFPPCIANSFSKKLTNHVGALWYFIHHYNAQQRTKHLTTIYA